MRRLLDFLLGPATIIAEDVHPLSATPLTWRQRKHLSEWLDFDIRRGARVTKSANDWPVLWLSNRYGLSVAPLSWEQRQDLRRAIKEWREVRL